MAGYSEMYVIGGRGGFSGADGVNPIEALLLVGNADRLWIEPHYFDSRMKPIGRLGTLVPSTPGAEDALLDACIAFCPHYFKACPSLRQVEDALGQAERLDFHRGHAEIPSAWAALREEARPFFRAIAIWQADLVPVTPA
jgi:hypothetical protein